MKNYINELAAVQYFGKSSQGYTEAEELTIRKALSILHDHMNDGTPLTSSDKAKNYCQLKIGRLNHEVFGILFLNNQNKVVSFEEVATGTINMAPVYPREVIKRVLANNAAAVILTHNHPSGKIAPSEADNRMTARLAKALDLIDVKVLDHIIVGLAGTFSYADNPLSRHYLSAKS